MELTILPSLKTFRFQHVNLKPPILPDTTGHLQLAKYEVDNLPRPLFQGAD
jgi:hypothetical protein